ETSSIVDVIAISKGQRVNKGDTIVNMSLEGRDNDLREAQAQLKTATSQQKAAASLRQKGLQSQLQLEQAQAALAAARAQLDRIQRDIANTQIRAPFSGVINDVPVEIGEMIDRGDIIAELVDNSGFTVTAQVAQQTLTKLELGKSINVELISGDTLPGKLTYISSVADSASRSFTVEAEIDNVEGKYAAGVSASLIIPVEQVEAVFISPSALSLGDKGDIGVKIIDESDQVVFTPIELVSSSLDGAWVTGIPDNSRVITLGQGFVKPGQAVEPVPAANASEKAS
ncbi:MAG: efflux RND transporter periplasmic adaptor subunit, partial [Gammaproteobacteria bacterium]|nr:efflux RND transporter periplasmic adaptor subunit [Gammaproteobacteria bacterium]